MYKISVILYNTIVYSYFINLLNNIHILQVTSGRPINITTLQGKTIESETSREWILFEGDMIFIPYVYSIDLYMYVFDHSSNELLHHGIIHLFLVFKKVNKDIRLISKVYIALTYV